MLRFFFDLTLQTNVNFNIFFQLDIDYHLLEAGALDGIEKLNSLTPTLVAYIVKKGNDPSVVKLVKYLADTNINAGNFHYKVDL